MCLGGEAQKLNEKVVWRAETSYDKVWLGLSLGGGRPSQQRVKQRRTQSNQLLGKSQCRMGQSSHVGDQLGGSYGDPGLSTGRVSEDRQEDRFERHQQAEMTGLGE